MLDDSEALKRADAVRRVVLGSGKIAIDLLGSEQRKRAEDVALVRMEELYPFPEEDIKGILASYPHVKEVTWVQEEPRNMGAWKYMYPRLRALLEPKMKLHVLARPESASPATGFSELFQVEQERLIEGALGSTMKEVGGTKHGR